MSEESNESRRVSVDDVPSGSSRPPAPSSAGSHAHEHHAGRFAIVSERGLHVRAAARLVLLVSRFPCVVTVRHGEVAANAKSVMELLLLRATCGSHIDVLATGRHARECLNEIETLISNCFGDPS